MTQKQIEKRKIELAEKISNGETNQTLLKWYREKYGIEKSVFYQDYESILDEVGDKYSEKLKRIATKWMMVLEKAMEGSMKEGQYSLISNQVAVLGKLAGISSEKVEHKHQIEGGINIKIDLQPPKKQLEIPDKDKKDITEITKIITEK